MADKYFAPQTGNDTNDGLSALLPKQNFSAHTQVAGDVFYGAGGETTNVEIEFTASGSAGNKTRLTSYGAGRHIVDGLGVAAACVDTSGYGQLDINNLDLKNATDFGIKIWGSSTYVDNCIISNVPTTAGISIQGSASNREDFKITNCQIDNCNDGIRCNLNQGNVVYSNITIDSNTVTNSGFRGIICNASASTSRFDNVTVSKNTVSGSWGVGINVRRDITDFPATPTLWNTNINIDSNITFNNGSCGIYCRTATQNSFVQNNVVYGNSANQTLGGIWCGENYGVIIQNNIIYDNLTNGIDGMGIFDDQMSVGHVIRWNVISGHTAKVGITIPSADVGSCGIATYRAIDSKIYGNVLHGNTTGIMLYAEPTMTENQFVENNTIFSSENSGVQCSTQNATIRNNISFQSGWRDFYASPSANGLTEDYNCFVTSRFDNGMSLGVNSISVDPQFRDSANNDFSLLSSSPCIDAGLNIPGVVNQLGDSYLLNDPDIGANKYVDLTISDIVTRGFGMWGNLSHVVTTGFDLKEIIDQISAGEKRTLSVHRQNRAARIPAQNRTARIH